MASYTLQFRSGIRVDNKAIANIFYETADLMEINGDDSFRIRSYRRAAEALEGFPDRVSSLLDEPKRLLEIPGIGKGMAANIQELCRGGKLGIHQELLEKYRPSMLELLKIQGLGPKTIALLWSAFQVSDVAGVEKLAREGKLRELPRLSEKSEQKILKAIENYRRITGRFLIDEADRTAAKLTEHLKHIKGIEKITPAGSLRRGRETVGDLDMLITGKCCVDDGQRAQLTEEILRFPGILEVLAKGDNKVSFTLRSGMQVDVRMLPPESYGAAMQYFTDRRTTTCRYASGRSRWATRSTSTGYFAWTITNAWPARPKMRSTASSSWRPFLPSCVRAAAKLRPQPSTTCLT